MLYYKILTEGRWDSHEELTQNTRYMENNKAEKRTNNASYMYFSLEVKCFASVLQGWSSAKSLRCQVRSWHAFLLSWVSSGCLEKPSHVITPTTGDHQGCTANQETVFTCLPRVYIANFKTTFNIRVMFLWYPGLAQAQLVSVGPEKWEKRKSYFVALTPCLQKRGYKTYLAWQLRTEVT